jgi:thiol-disulfide isomerase/thioredoxin
MSRANKSTEKRGSRAPLLIAAALVVGIGGIAMMSSGCGAKSPAVGSATIDPASPAPSTTDNVQQSLEAFRGKVVILDFWATWCGPCRMEIPGFIALQNKYRNQGLEIIGVSIDPIAPRGNPAGAPAVAPFMKSFGINYTIMMVDKPAALAGFDVSRGIPTTYVLDRQGRIVKTYIGAQPDTVFESDVKQLL